MNISRAFGSSVFAPHATKLMSAGLLTFFLAGVGWAQSSTGATQHVEISFAGRLGGRPFACGSRYENVGTEKNTVTPQDLRFFVSNVELLTAEEVVVPVALDQDGIWQYKSVALIDLEDGTGACRNGNPAIHKVVSGSVPVGNYAGLRFTVGVPFELDHGDTLTATSPLNMTAMFWSWQSGYKFIRAEVGAVVAPAVEEKSDTSSSGHETGAQSGPAVKRRASGFPVHIGSTGCASANQTSPPEGQCKHPNLVTVTLVRFDAARDLVIFDLDKLLAGSDVTMNTPNTPPGCMSVESDPDCIPVMKALGLAFRDTAAIPQVVFYAEPRP